MGQKSKQKGAGFERQIAKTLSLWLSHGDRDDLLWRSSLSGGRATLQVQSGNTVGNQSGDLSPIGAEAMDFSQYFTVECKHYKDIFLTDIVYGLRKGDGIGKFWEQAKNDADQAEKFPLLIAKQNFGKEIIAMPQHIMLQVQKDKNFYPAHADILPASIVKLEDFLENVTPEELIEIVSNT